MRLREYLAPQVATLVLFASSFGLSTAFLRSALCIEGGTVVGYPWTFFSQCYAYAPGGPLGAAEFLAAPLVMDLVFWYLVSLLMVIAGIAALRRLRGR